MGNNVEEETSASVLYSEDGDRNNKMLVSTKLHPVNYMAHVRLFDTAVRKETLTKITSLTLFIYLFIFSFYFYSVKFIVY